MQISESAFKSAALQLDCEVAAIKAVASVESLGSPFLSNGQPKILFEAHIFHRLTKGKYSKTHPNIRHLS